MQVTKRGYSRPEQFDQQEEVRKASEFIKNYNQESLPSVGICILTKDSLELITDCVESIRKEVKYPNTKLYLFDTGTEDRRVLSYYDSLKKNYPFPIEIYNLGKFHYSKNYNEGLKSIDTDYALIQNNDTVALNDYISRLMKLAVVDKVGVSGPRMLYKNFKIQHDGQRLYNHQQKTLRKCLDHFKR